MSASALQSGAPDPGGFALVIHDTHLRGQGTRHAPDLTIPMELTLEEVFDGKQQNITVTRERLCKACGATGSANPEGMSTVSTQCSITATYVSSLSIKVLLYSNRPWLTRGVATTAYLT